MGALVFYGSQFLIFLTLFYIIVAGAAHIIKKIFGKK